MANELSVPEQHRLSACEADIERGGRMLATAMQVIHDEKLYRATYGTFADYCRERWGITGRHANRLLAHEKVVANLAEIGPIGSTFSERASREIADLPPAKQVEIVTKAAENGQKPTARAVKEARQQVEQPAKPKVLRADADMPPFQIDETGAEVPAQLVGIFERREQFRRAARLCRDAAGILHGLQKETAGRYLGDEADSLEHLAGEIDLAMPHSVSGQTWRCGRGG